MYVEIPVILVRLDFGGSLVSVGDYLCDYFWGMEFFWLLFWGQGALVVSRRTLFVGHSLIFRAPSN